jgi:hypothetical protein
VSDAFNPKQPYTAKLVAKLDGDLKNVLIQKLGTDTEFRATVGAQEL